MSKKELIIGSVGAALIIFFMWPKTGDKEKLPGVKPANPEKVERLSSASIVLTAYKKAKAANEPPEKLAELNKILWEKYGMKVKINKEGLLAVFNSEDKAVLYDKKG